MEILDSINLMIKPIFHTINFELKKQRKKFVIFLIISIVILLLISLLPYALIPDNPLPDTQIEYFNGGVSFLPLTILFAACFFFSGIICSEFSKKTGYIIFPKINKYKLIVGKYLGNLILITTIIALNYLVLGLLGVFSYRELVDIRLYISFGIALFYILAISSFVTVFSSLLKSVNMTIVATILILLIGFDIVSSLTTLANPDLEPIYSLTYLSTLITSVLNEVFPEIRYTEITQEDFTFRIWLTPTIGIGIIVLAIYTVSCLILAALLFKRKQI